MARFVDLPNELILEVLKHLEPFDFYGFYSINRHFYTLTGLHRLGYSRLKSDFARPPNTSYPGIAACLILKVLKLPQAAQYVQRWKIDGCLNHWLPDREYEDEMRHEEYSPADMALLEHLFQEAAHIEPSEKIKRIEFMKGGGEEDLIVLALPMFPNLTLIEFRASNDHVLPRLFEFTQFIAAGRAQTSTGNTPLSSLTRINIGVSTRGTSPGWVDILTVQAFAILPSVRVINADCLYGSMNDLKSDIPPFLHSNVTDLKFSRADLPPDRVMLLLEGFDSLQSFAYWSARNSSRPSLFSPFLIIKGLLASSQQTLRELYLRAGNEDWDYMGSLCRFTALESLETDLLLLLGPLPRTKVTFETSLPPSIRILKLYGGPSLMYTRDMQCQNLLNGLPNLKIRFSKLSNIALLGFKIPEIRAQDMARRCGDVGTTLVVMHRGLNVYPIFDRHQGHRIEYSPHDDKVVHEYLD